MKNNKKRAAIKCLSYLESKSWIFDSHNKASKDLIEIFEKCGTNKNDLVDIIVSLMTKKKDWGFYNLQEIKRIDEARKIYRKYTKHYAR